MTLIHCKVVTKYIIATKFQWIRPLQNYKIIVVTKRGWISICKSCIQHREVVRLHKGRTISLESHTGSLRPA